ncbi:RHS repeat domain-containing protein [Chitinophaga ginsengisoli]|nr:RHS repeat domain-containing protein [Chitinophaga ginsengisoli]
MILSTSLAQVNLPTGKAEFNFPLYSYTDGNRLSTAVSLNYTGGNGIKVDEMASSVGLGWQLQCGGVISRTAIGDPDDQIGRELPDYDAIGYGRMKHTYERNCMPMSGWVPLLSTPATWFKHNAQTIADREQDLFTFRFGAESGSFVIGTDGSILPVEDTHLKIEKVEEDMSANGIITTISKFVITTESGIQYVFNDKTLNRVISYSTGIPVQFFKDVPYANWTFFLSKTSYRLYNYYSVDNWLLTEINNPMTGKKITFNYDSYTLDYIAGEDATQSVEQVDASNSKEVVQWVQRRFNGTVKRLRAIQLPNNAAVNFTYYDNDRVDLAGDKALKQIAIIENGVEKSGYVFNYQYFSKGVIRPFTYSFPADESGNARLSLQSVQRKGMNNYLDKPYSFSYFISDNVSGWVPPRMSSSQDHWGYYNGIATYPYDNNFNIYKNCENLFKERQRFVNASATAKNGCLRTVTYPTGGTLNFEYESNRAYINNAEVLAAGVRVKKITQSDGVDDTKLITTEYKYVDEAGHPSSWGYEAPLYNRDANSLLVVPKGLDFYVATLVYNIMPNVISQGLMQMGRATAIKSGEMASKYAGAALQINLLTTIITYMVGKIIQPDGNQEVSKTTAISYSSHPAKANLLPFLYKRVEVYNGTQESNIGKTVFTFTSNEDFPLFVPTLDAPYSSRSRAFLPAYGLTKAYKVYNKLNEPVLEVYNKYNVLVLEHPTGLHGSIKCVPSMILITNNDNLGAYMSRIAFFSDAYYAITGRVEMEYSVEKKYGIGDYIMNRTDYTYDPNYFNVKKITTTGSNGDITEKRIYYPYDYNIAGPLSQMKSNNIIDVPVSSETWILKAGSQQLMVGAQIMDYQQITNGDFKPVNVYNLVTDKPIDQSIVGQFDATKLKWKDEYFKTDISYSYNSNGDLSQIVEYGTAGCVLKDDRSESVIATVKNAGLNDIAYSSFEDGALGNWQLSSSAPSMIMTDADAPTGKKVLLLSSSSTLSRSGLTQTKEYILSYWYKGGAVNISGGTVTSSVSVKTVNGWTLNVLRVRSANSLTITGSAYVDELRLYPADAKMVTRCHNELMKVVTETAADNNSVYYEYDELGRLKATRDADKNIRGFYEYKDHQ